MENADRARIQLSWDVRRKTKLYINCQKTRIFTLQRALYLSKYFREIMENADGARIQLLCDVIGKTKLYINFQETRMFLANRVRNPTYENTSEKLHIRSSTK